MLTLKGIWTEVFEVVKSWNWGCRSSDTSWYQLEDWGFCWKLDEVVHDIVNFMPVCFKHFLWFQPYLWCPMMILIDEHILVRVPATNQIMVDQHPHFALWYPHYLPMFIAQSYWFAENRLAPNPRVHQHFLMFPILMTTTSVNPPVLDKLYSYPIKNQFWTIPNRMMAGDVWQYVLIDNIHRCPILSLFVPLLIIIVYPNHRTDRLKVSRAVLCAQGRRCSLALRLAQSRRRRDQNGDAGILQLIAMKQRWKLRS